jgi:hypothetical protein
MTRLASVAICVSLLAGMAGCDMLGIESPEKLAAARDADGRAIGGACRHAGRAIEDCYALNRKADRAAIFSGWRDMNDYMRENKLEPVLPVMSAQAPASKPSEPEGAQAKKEDGKSSGQKASKPEGS